MSGRSIDAAQTEPLASCRSIRGRASAATAGPAPSAGHGCTCSAWPTRRTWATPENRRPSLSPSCFNGAGRSAPATPPCRRCAKFAGDAGGARRGGARRRNRLRGGRHGTIAASTTRRSPSAHRWSPIRATRWRGIKGAHIFRPWPAPRASRRRRPNAPTAPGRELADAAAAPGDPAVFRAVTGERDRIVFAWSPGWPRRHSAVPRSPSPDRPRCSTPPAHRRRSWYLGEA